MNKANWRARARGPRPPPRLSEDASGGHTKDCRNARTFSAGCLDNRCRCWRTTTSVAFGGPCESSARWRRSWCGWLGISRPRFWGVIAVFDRIGSGRRTRVEATPVGHQRPTQPLGWKRDGAVLKPRPHVNTHAQPEGTPRAAAI